MAKKTGILALVGTVFLAICLAAGLYRWDNKYTYPTDQPTGGVLFYQEGGVHFLAQEWAFYPEMLLSPQQVEDYGSYRQYVDIGGTQTMDCGSGTYQLTLMLPETLATYALEIPEVFSAYRLYVDDTLVYQMGNPDPDAYQMEIANEVIPFSASGATQILLAVTDYQGIYSGLIYPPAFGSAEQVQHIHEIRLVVHSAQVLVALVAILLALIFGIRAKGSKGFLGVCLGICVVGISGCPLFYGLFHIPFYTAYLFEIGCYYVLLVLALFLQCHFCQLPRRLAWGLVAPGLAVCLIALIYYAALEYWPDWGGVLVSIFSLSLKYYTAVCLLALAVYGVGKSLEHFAVFQCGAVAYAVFLVADRLLPFYEPIVGSWFGELGGVCLAVAVGCGLWLDTIDAYRFRLAYAENHRRMESRLALQKEHYLELSQQIKGARESAHDLRHHMRVLRTMANQGQFPQLVAYLDSYEPHLSRVQIQVWSEHPVADSILAHYANIAHQLGGTYDAQLTIPPQLTIPDDEFCVILSNLLENATEAMARQKWPPRRIYMRGAIEHHNLGIVMDNTFDGWVETRHGHFLSSKHQGLGLGLSSVSAIVEKHGGLVEFTHEGTVFHTSIMLPLPKKEANFL